MTLSDDLRRPSSSRSWWKIIFQPIRWMFEVSNQNGCTRTEPHTIPQDLRLLLWFFKLSCDTTPHGVQSKRQDLNFPSTILSKQPCSWSNTVLVFWLGNNNKKNANILVKFTIIQGRFSIQSKQIPFRQMTCIERYWVTDSLLSMQCWFIDRTTKLGVIPDYTTV